MYFLWSLIDLCCLLHLNYSLFFLSITQFFIFNSFCKFLIQFCHKHFSLISLICQEFNIFCYFYFFLEHLEPLYQKLFYFLTRSHICFPLVLQIYAIYFSVRGYILCKFALIWQGHFFFNCWNICLFPS